MATAAAERKRSKPGGQKKRAATSKASAGRRKAPRRVPRATARTASGRKRLAVVYDIEGPRVRLGFVWFVSVVAALIVGSLGLALLYGLTAVAAAAQASRCWQSKKIKPNVMVAAAFAGLMPVLAVLGPAGAGLAAIGLPVGALIVCGAGSRPLREALGEAGYTIQVALFPGLAAASVVLLRDLRLGAAVAIVLLASAYECGDFLVGTGAQNSFEGPIAGIAAALVVTFTIAALQIAPFDFASAFAFGGFAALAIPAGQFLASAILPWAGSRAPAMRRLDSLLVAAPAWYVLADLFLV